MKLNFTSKLFLALLCVNNGVFSQINSDEVKYWLGTGMDTSYILLNSTASWDGTSKTFGFLHDGNATVQDMLDEVELNDDAFIINTTVGIDSIGMGYAINGMDTDTSDWNIFTAPQDLSSWTQIGSNVDQSISGLKVIGVAFTADNTGSVIEPSTNLEYRESPTYHDADIEKVKYFVGEGDLTTVVLVDFKKPNIKYSLAYGVRFSQGQTLEDLLNTLADAYDGFSYGKSSWGGLDSIAIDTLNDLHINGEYWGYYKNDLSDNLGSSSTGQLADEVISEGHYYSFVFAKGTAQRSRPVFAPAANENGSNAVSKDSSIIVAWATGATITRGFEDITATPQVEASYGEEADAIGAAEGTSADVVSLGDGGEIILTFGTPIMDGEGPDFAVFENGFSHTYLELAFVEVSSDGVDYFRFSAVSLTHTFSQVGNFGGLDSKNLYNLAGSFIQGYGTPFDLAELPDNANLDKNNITHIKLVDVVGSIDAQYGLEDSEGNLVNDPFTNNSPSAGFDLDGVGVINENVEASLTQSNSGDAQLVYPNPATNVVNFDIKESASIYTITGELIQEVDLTSKSSYSLNELGLEAGIYIVKSGDLSQKLIIK